jgi:hypothetical protein
MRFMMIVKGDENFRASGPPPKELMAAIDKLMEDTAKTPGKMVSTGGLQHTSKGARVLLRGGKLTVVDGPFTEAKEMIGGFAIMDLASKEEAIEESKKFMELHRLHWPGWDGESEIRQMYDGPPDFAK